MKETKIAIITARGGSKRIPRKNIKEFCGRPIIQYSIEAALKSGVFDEVMVSTDDEEIAEIALNAGAIVPFLRSNDNSNDFASTTDVLKEVLDEYKKQGIEFKYGCCIYPTAPFITADKLKAAMKLLVSNATDTVMPIVAYSFPPQRSMIIKNERACMKWPEYSQSRSQDLESFYHDCGQYYAFNIENFMKSGSIIGGDITPIVTSDLEVQDIDNLEDWFIAEMKYKLMLEKSQ